jgi:glyoxylase-like metal-dependent hydrolase (beta-lactamase superfamily II)
MSGTAGLRYDVHVSGMVPAAGQPLPDGYQPQWSPLAHTLVYGPTEALLTDPPITRQQADVLIDWVKSHQVSLRYIYLTHAHADHWLTTSYLLARLPEATVVAAKPVLSRIAADTPDGAVPGLWSSLFGPAVPDAPVTVNGTEFPAGGLRLDGHELFAHQVGHSDTDDTTVLHVPSLELVVGGDVVYNNVRQYVAEAGAGGLEAWHHALAAVAAVAALQPRWLVSGHKDATRRDLASDVGETRRYLDAAGAAIASSSDRAGFYANLKGRYPQRVNPYTIWLSALRLFES